MRARVLVGIVVGILLRAVVSAQITAVWANSGEDKVTREEVRASSGKSVLNSLWDGGTIRLFASRNEVVSFNLVLEAQNATATNVSVSFDTLTGPDSAKILSASVRGNGVFDWTQRPIELFYVRYLQIDGISSDLHYDDYDERHIPKRFRRPWSGPGDADPGTDWFDRPDHDRHYPEIAVPLELVGSFDIVGGESQSVWADIYVPKSVPPGTFEGTVSVRQSGAITHLIPVQLRVSSFTLPDTPTAGTMIFLGQEDIANRYTGDPYPGCGSAADALTRLVRDRHFQLAHRHRLSLIDNNDGPCSWSADQPRPEWGPRLDGSLFTAATGYAGPGVGVGNGVFSIGTYGSWSWQGEGQQSMWNHTNAWESWFQTNSPSTERFLYLTDEPDTSDAQEMAQVEQWASWIANNPGPGNSLLSLVTMSLTEARTTTPSVDIPASWFTVGTSSWRSAVDAYRADASKRVYFYNGNRPATGSFATEDDGVALRVLAWTQYKMGIDRWFFWESTYYDNFQGGTGETDVFRQAQTFGGNDGFDPIRGESGYNYGNGDGVLFYPGTDVLFPLDSYGVDGPFVSLRLKHWRRGIQDVEYLVAAAQVDAVRVAQIVDRTLPRVLWENGVTEPQDPTYVLTDISWSTDPDDWEEARCELAAMLDPAAAAACGGDSIFEDGFESGDTSAWSSP